MNFDLSNIDDIRSLSFQIIALLFVAVAVYLYINFKSNRKRIGERKLVLTKPVSNSGRSGVLPPVHNDFYSAIPLPLCRISLKGEVEIYNKSFSDFLPEVHSDIKFKLLHHLFNDDLNAFFRDLVVKAQRQEWNEGEKIEIKGKVYRVLVHYFEKTTLDSAYVFILFEPIVESLALDEAVPVNVVLKNLIEESSAAMLLLNHEGEVILDNQSACSLYGKEKECLRGMNIRAILPVEFQDKAGFSFDDLFSGDLLVFRGFLCNAEGKLIPVSVRPVRLTIDIKYWNLLFIDDISLFVSSENKLIEADRKVEQSDLLKASFLTNMSHEIRTPLNAILGFSELLNDPAIGAGDRHEFIKQIKQSGESLLDLMSSIINFSRISSGALLMVNEKVDLNDVFVDLQRFAVKTNKSKSRPIDIRINMPVGGVDYFLFSDKDKIFQSLKNLIDNAIKFTYSGSVEFGCRERGKEFIEFFVKDTGIGISNKSRKVIFKRFVQGDDSNCREFGGTGIGLTISAELVRLLGGFLWIESAVDIGSCFNIVLPKNFSQFKHQHHSNYFGNDFSARSILVLDVEEHSYSDLLHVAINKQQQQFFWAQNIGEGKNIALSNQIDLILINGNCEIEGEQLSIFIQKQTKGIPVLSFNQSVDSISGIKHLKDYPFTEKGMMMLYREYLHLGEFSTSSNSMSI